MTKAMKKKPLTKDQMELKKVLNQIEDFKDEYLDKENEYSELLFEMEDNIGRLEHAADLLRDLAETALTSDGPMDVSWAVSDAENAVDDINANRAEYFRAEELMEKAEEKMRNLTEKAKKLRKRIKAAKARRKK